MRKDLTIRDNGFAQAREAMVSEQIEARGIEDRNLLAAMRLVPRESFVPDDQKRWAYSDGPLPIGLGQTISQPYVVALMAHAARVKPGDRILDVGTGSGYAAAVLSRMAKDVFSIERHGTLARNAQRILSELGYDNVRIAVGDGSLGWPSKAPFDAIIVAAGGPAPPAPLLEQLAPGGCLIMPVGQDRHTQKLLRVTRHDGEFRRESLGAVAFVPLVGKQGWESGAESKDTGEFEELSPPQKSEK